MKVQTLSFTSDVCDTLDIYIEVRFTSSSKASGEKVLQRQASMTWDFDRSGSSPILLPSRLIHAHALAEK